METVAQIERPTSTRRTVEHPQRSTVDVAELVSQIARQRDSVLDLEIVVDDARHHVDRAVEAQRVAVQERDAAAAHLKQLVEWFDESAGA